MIVSLGKKKTDLSEDVDPSKVLNHSDDIESPEKGALASILSPSRLSALKTCDSKLLQYDTSSFMLVFRLRGRNMKMMFLPLLSLVSWGVMWVLLFERLDITASQKFLASALDDLISPLLTPVSFLLVFRLGRAAVRFWDARKAAGKLIEDSRSLFSLVAAADHINSAQKEAFARWTCAFPIANKNFLRSQRAHWEDHMDNNAIIIKRRAEFGSLLPKGDTETILDTGSKNGERFAPVFVLNRLRQLTYQVTCKPPEGSATSDPNAGVWTDSASGQLYRQLNEQIDNLTGAWGAMERIHLTPLPFVYVVHLRTFLLLYLLLWHLQAVAKYGWYALPALFAASWGLIGIEAAAVKCERPFSWEDNHLALGQVCVVVAQNIAQTIQDVDYFNGLHPMST